MKCPWCKADEDRVVDSRPVDGGESIRRRRECRACRRRYTTFERVENAWRWKKRNINVMLVGEMSHHLVMDTTPFT